MAANSSEKKTVLIVDDSVFARKITTDILQSSSKLEVIGVATNGLEAIALAAKLKPDVITLDIEMPKLDGLGALRRIMDENPTPVVVLSSLTAQGTNECIQALRLGAVEVMLKPSGSQGLGLSAIAEELISKVLAAADVKVSHLQPIAPIKAVPTREVRAVGNRFPIVMIASSTGGPRALRTLVPALTNAEGVAYVIVQHLPPGFTGPFARDLDSQTSLRVRESSEDDIVSPGDLIFAKSGFHTVFDKTGKMRITSDPSLWGVRPSADITMASAVQVFGRRLIGVILTGMGRDGANGLKLIKEAGGMTLAEHESTCVVYGMPRAAVEMDVVDAIVPLPYMAEAIHATVWKVGQSLRRRKEPVGIS